MGLIVVTMSLLPLVYSVQFIRKEKTNIQENSLVVTNIHIPQIQKQNQKSNKQPLLKKQPSRNQTTSNVPSSNGPPPVNRQKKPTKQMNRNEQKQYSRKIYSDRILNDTDV